MRRLSSSSCNVLDPVHSRRRARELLGVSVWALKNQLTGLCAERGFPLGESREQEGPEVERESDTGTRRPTVNDVIRALRDISSINTCSRDGLAGCALVDLPLFAEAVGPANLLLVFQWGDALGDIVEALDYWCGSNAAAHTTFVWLEFMCINHHRPADKVISMLLRCCPPGSPVLLFSPRLTTGADNI